MFDIGGAELVFIVFVVLMLFGPKKIPEVAKMMSNGMQKLKNAQNEFSKEISNIKDELNQSIQDEKEKLK